MEGQEEGLVRDHHDGRALEARVSAHVQAHASGPPLPDPGDNTTREFSVQVPEPGRQSGIQALPFTIWVTWGN